MESVKLIECPRDAWQGLPRQISTEQKAEYLRALIGAGFRHLDAVSFVSPKAVPQMADSEAVLAQLGATDGVEIIGIVVNEKGAERAIATGKVMTLGYPCSISETFLRRNQNQSIEENHQVLKRIKALADAAGLQLVVYISMAFGNPYGDPWSETQLVEAAREVVPKGRLVIVGCSAESTRYAVRLTKNAAARGADAARRVFEAAMARPSSRSGMSMYEYACIAESVSGNQNEWSETQATST